jgi:RNA polymerase sigma-70 factor (ECF subfamily)
MTTEDDDLAVWRSAASGDPDAFAVLFHRHARAVYNHCFRQSGSWSEAEDLTSVVFLEAWRRRATVRLERGSVRAWLLGVATNVCRNRTRSLRRHRAALSRVPDPATQPDPAADVAARVDDERTIRTVLDEVRRLPRREREVLVLCAWDGLSYAEAAIALGVPIGTVRSRLSRARSRLVRSGHQQTSERQGALRTHLEELR